MYLIFYILSRIGKGNRYREVRGLTTIRYLSADGNVRRLLIFCSHWLGGTAPIPDFPIRCLVISLPERGLILSGSVVGGDDACRHTQYR